MQNVSPVLSRGRRRALQMTAIQSLLDIVSYATMTVIIAGFMGIYPKTSADKGDFSK